MHRIDTPGSVNGEFRFGNPFATPKVPGTIVGAFWLNAVQEELVAVIEAAGLALDKEDNGQLLAAVLANLEKVADDRIGLDYVMAAPYDVSVGEGFLVADTFLVAKEAKTAGQDTLGWVTGVHPLPKSTDPGTDFAAGQAAYWDDANRRTSNSASGNRLIGWAAVAADEEDATVQVRLNGASTLAF